MATPVIMPRQGQSVESCIISNWAKKVGDKVSIGDILFTYETDKATFDETAKTEGTLLAAFFVEGDDVPCLTNVCVIGNSGESFEEFNPNSKSAAPVAKETAPVAQAIEVKASVANTAPVAPVASSNAHPVIMPRQGQSVESCIISKWAKKVGDKVSVGELLFTYETDKATFDEMSKFDGTILAIFSKEGDDVPCLQNVCVIGIPGDGFEMFNPNASVATAIESAPIAPVVATIAPIATPIATKTENGKTMISPRAKNLAARTGINASFVEGSGPYGRIIENDIKNAIASGAKTTFAASAFATTDMIGTSFNGKIGVNDLNAPVAAVAEQSASVSTTTPVATSTTNEVEYTDVKLPNIRKVIAKSMHASLSNMAQLTLNSSFDTAAISEYRKLIKENKDKLGLENVTLNDIILFAVSRTIMNHKDVNAHYLEDSMRYFTNCHLGVAVDTPRGLMVPTIRNANIKSLNEISAEAKKVASEAQKGTISPDALKGGTFTVTNLGTMGIESFTPVINPPQTCILGVNTIETRVKNVGGEMKMYNSMTLSLTFDHRALDGAPAAKFLQELCKNLENFTLLLAK